MIYPAKCDKCGDVEISKPMADAFPKNHDCGGKLTRRFVAPAVVYAAAGFYATDVDRFKKQIGGERFARFEAQRAGAQARAKTGTLSNYERILETI